LSTIAIERKRDEMHMQRIARNKDQGVRVFLHLIAEGGGVGRGEEEKGEGGAGVVQFEIFLKNPAGGADSGRRSGLGMPEIIASVSWRSRNPFLALT